MFDWLFGSGRQTNFDDTNKLYGQFNHARTAADSYFDKNIAGKDWGTLGNEEKARLTAEYGDLTSKADSLFGQYNMTNDLFNQEEKANRNNYFGNGLLGAVLNPFAQTLDAGVDFAQGNYEKNGRDLMSDLGAVGQSALTFIPGIGLASKATKFGKAASSVPGMAATGAGIGGLEALREGGSNTQMQDVLGGAGSGALFGAAFPVAGRAVNKGLMTRGAKNYNPESVYSGLSQAGINPLQAAYMAADPSSKTLRSVGMRNIMPKSKFGNLALGGGALYGGNMLMNSMNRIS